MEAIALLACSTLFGGMMLYSFGFAPFVFKTVEGAEASRLLRAAFPFYYLFILAAAMLAAIPLILTDPLSAMLMTATAAIAVYARQGLMPMINAARDAQLAGDAAAKTRFDRLHGLSVVLNFVQLAAIGYVLACFL